MVVSACVRVAFFNDEGDKMIHLRKPHNSRGKNLYFLVQFVCAHVLAFEWWLVFPDEQRRLTGFGHRGQRPNV